MDESKEYIAMCREAEEIQALWNPYYGDWYLDKVNNKPYICSKVKKAKKRKRIGELIWLPRQDQLQKMTKYNSGISKGHIVLPEDFIVFLFHSLGGIGKRINESFFGIPHIFHPEQYTSMEQITLAFIMIINYNKKWLGNCWMITETKE